MSPPFTPHPKTALLFLSDYSLKKRCEYSVSGWHRRHEKEEEEEEVQSSSQNISSRDDLNVTPLFSLGAAFGSFLRRRRGLTAETPPRRRPPPARTRRRRPSVLRNGRGGRLRVAVGADDVVAGESRNRFSDFPSGVRLGATVLRKSARKNATRPRGFSATAERFELRDERGTVRV